MNLIGQVVFHVCDIYRIKEKALDKTWIQSPSIMTCMIQWEGHKTWLSFSAFPVYAKGNSEELALDFTALSTFYRYTDTKITNSIKQLRMSSSVSTRVRSIKPSIKKKLRAFELLQNFYCIVNISDA